MESVLSPEAAGVVVVGLVSGALYGMAGVGGSVLTQPGIRLLGASPLLAVGSAVPALIPGALSGAARYARAQLVNWRVGLTCGLAGSGMAVLGAWIAGQLDARLLLLATAGLLAWAGIKTFRSSQSSDGLADGPPVAAVRPAWLVALGAFTGLLAGLLGIGGGVLLVPAFVTLLRLPAKEAVASSLVAASVLSIPAAATHAALGHVDWRYALLLLAGVVPGAQVGARFTIAGSGRRTQAFVGVFLAVLAVAYAAHEVSGLL